MAPEDNTSSHIQTRDALYARMQSCGVSVDEIITLESFKDDFPPPDCVASHPAGLAVGRALPDPEGSMISLKNHPGNYSFALISKIAYDQFIENNPEISAAANAPDLTQKFDIASLFAAVDAQAQANTQESTRTSEGRHNLTFDKPPGMG